jgi:hypothetical protein
MTAEQMLSFRRAFPVLQPTAAHVMNEIQGGYVVDEGDTGNPGSGGASPNLGRGPSGRTAGQVNPR